MMDALEVAAYLKELVDDQRFTCSSDLRRSLNDAADGLYWLSRQTDFVHRNDK